MFKYCAVFTDLPLEKMRKTTFRRVHLVNASIFLGGISHGKCVF